MGARRGTYAAVGAGLMAAGLAASGCGTSGRAASVQAAARTAVPKRGDGRTERVYLVHGFNLTGADCAGTWNTTQWSLRRDGWKGALDSVAYYANDTGCSVAVSGRRSYSANTSIKELGRAFAWLVYNRDTKHGRSVDVVGHSMGGLVIRAALTGVRNHDKGFPPRLYVEDAVTLGSPHRGNVNFTCPKIQCREMRGEDGGRLLGWLRHNPQPAQGTDWTLVGSNADEVVPTGSALGMRAGHRVRYAKDENLGHGPLIYRPDAQHPARKGYHMWYRKPGTPAMHETKNGWAPLSMVDKALYSWHRW